MFNWKRTPWVAALALGAVLALAGGCSDDDDDDDDGDDINLRSGTWSETSTTTVTGGAGCEGNEGPITDTVEICDSDSAFVPGDLDCDVNTNGDEFSFHCTFPTTVGGCTITLHLDAEGTFTETTYTSTFTTFSTVNPTTPPCNEFANPCTTTVHSTGTWQNENGCDGKPGVPVRTLVRRAAALAGAR